VISGFFNQKDMAKRGKSKKDKKKEKDEQVGGETQVSEEFQGEDTSEPTEPPAAETPVEEPPAAETPVEEPLRQKRL
jgi:hypothetical protein